MVDKKVHKKLNKERNKLLKKHNKIVDFMASDKTINITLPHFELLTIQKNIIYSYISVLNARMNEMVKADIDG